VLLPYLDQGLSVPVPQGPEMFGGFGNGGFPKFPEFHQMGEMWMEPMRNALKNTPWANFMNGDKDKDKEHKSKHNSDAE